MQTFDSDVRCGEIVCAPGTYFLMAVCEKVVLVHNIPTSAEIVDFQVTRAGASPVDFSPDESAATFRGKNMYYQSVLKIVPSTVGHGTIWSLDFAQIFPPGAA